MSLDWAPSPKFLATSLHIGWALAFTLAAQHAGWVAWQTTLAVSVWAVFKEYLADLTFLEHDTLRGTTLDAVAYEIGGGLGVWGWLHLYAAGSVAAALLLGMLY